jgi:glucose-1-phosphate cytidylyltransferase
MQPFAPHDSPATPPVVILCGGRGTRFKEQTELRPKPMIEIGGRPILWHLMSSYASQGFREFVLCLGYKAEVIKRYFLDFAALQHSFTVELGRPSQVVYHGAGGGGAGVSGGADWKVTCVDTGEAAMTGARLKRAERFLGGGDFLLTYGDGLCDVDVARTVAFHRRHGGLCTVTGVRPPARFGELALGADHKVAEFAEKPAPPSSTAAGTTAGTAAPHGWINGGFFVLSRGFLRYVTDDDACVLEGEPLRRCAADGQMSMFPHEGYWQCMDTARDLEKLEAEWASGRAPWRRWM